MPNQEHVLDLDALQPEPRYVVIGGQRHEIVPMTLEMYAKSVQLQQDMERLQRGEYDQALLERVYEAIVAAIPTIDVATLRRMNVFALQKLMAYIEEAVTEVLAKIAEIDGVQVTEGEGIAAEGGE